MSACFLTSIAATQAPIIKKSFKDGTISSYCPLALRLTALVDVLEQESVLPVVPS